MMRCMVVDMNDAQLHTLDQLHSFLKGTVALGFSVAPNERYEFVARTVRRFGYVRLMRPVWADGLRHGCCGESERKVWIALCSICILNSV